MRIDSANIWPRRRVTVNKPGTAPYGPHALMGPWLSDQMVLHMANIISRASNRYLGAAPLTALTTPVWLEASNSDTDFPQRFTANERLNLLARIAADLLTGLPLVLAITEYRDSATLLVEMYPMALSVRPTDAVWKKLAPDDAQQLIDEIVTAIVHDEAFQVAAEH